ncbi:MAG: hypothetical protein ACLSAF_19860 [Intestinimonas sp.]
MDTLLNLMGEGSVKPAGEHHPPSCPGSMTMLRNSLKRHHQRAHGPRRWVSCLRSSISLIYLERLARSAASCPGWRGWRSGPWTPH